MRRYRKSRGGLPSDHIVDLCAGGNKLYMSFRESDRYGVAAADPASGAVAILAPTSRRATFSTEPVLDAYRVWWDSVNSRLLVNNFFLYESVRGYQPHRWVLTDRTWRRIGTKEVFPRFVVSDGKESVQMRIDGRDCIFEFLGSGETIRCRLPLPDLVGEPAWDSTRLWAPTYMGLYEINRLSGHAEWVAHQDHTQALAALTHEGRLYLATTRGLYWCAIPD